MHLTAPTSPMIEANTPVSFLVVPIRYARHNRPVYAPKSPISLIPLFFEAPCIYIRLFGLVVSEGTSF